MAQYGLPTLSAQANIPRAAPSIPVTLAAQPPIVWARPRCQRILSLSVAYPFASSKVSSLITPALGHRSRSWNDISLRLLRGRSPTHRFGLAFATVPIPSLAHVAVLMATRARRLCRVSRRDAGRRTAQILDMRHRFKMVRVYAGADPAQMINFHALCERAVFDFPRGDMCPQNFAAADHVPQLAIPTIPDAPKPQRTTRHRLRHRHPIQLLRQSGSVAIALLEARKHTHSPHPTPLRWRGLYHTAQGEALGRAVVGAAAPFIPASCR